MIAVVGPTACQKTRRAVALARRVHGEIISGDSRQVYRGMDLGTGKDLEEYEGVPYHLIDIADAGDKYNLHRYLADFNNVMADMRARGVTPVLCGGSGMYVEAALSGITMPEVPRDEELRASLSGKTLAELTDILSARKRLHNSTDVDTVARALRAIEIEYYYERHPEEAALSDRSKARPLDALIIGVDIPRDERRRRISARLDRRLESGMVAEVERLLQSGVSPESLIYYGLEYKYLTLYVTGAISYEAMRRQLEIAIHQFAKRQMTWWRGMERRGFTIHWLPYDLSDQDFTDAVMRLAEERGTPSEAIG